MDEFFDAADDILNSLSEDELVTYFEALEEGVTAQQQEKRRAERKAKREKRNGK